MNNKAKELNKRNNEMDKYVDTANQRILTDMICYLRGADISDYDQELVRQDLLEMILSGQKRGEDIHSIIGGDYKEFCDDIIANLSEKTKKQKVIDFFDILCWGFSFLGMIHILIADETMDLVKNLFTQQPLNFNISVSMGVVLSMVIVIVAAFGVVQYIAKNALRKEEKKAKPWLKGAFIGILVMGLFIFIMWLGRETLFTVNIFVACAVVVGLFMIHKILERL